jgi:uncharacterized protein (TIGR02147 family)
MEWRKEAKLRPYSFNEVSKALGLNSKSHLHNLVHKPDKTPSLNLQNKISQWLRLGTKQQSYFSLLIALDQASNIHEKEEVFSQIAEIVPKRNTVAFDSTKYAYFKNWYYPVVRELACISNWDGDFQVLSTLVYPKISVHQARHAVRDLLSLGLLSNKAIGVWDYGESNIHSGDETQSAAIYVYQKELLELSQDALVNIDLKDREINTLNFSIADAKLPELKKKIQAQQRELIQWLNENQDGENQIYQFNTQMFPVSKKFLDRGKSEKNK